jgi:hypothetical protein
MNASPSEISRRDVALHSWAPRRIKPSFLKIYLTCTSRSNPVLCFSSLRSFILQISQSVSSLLLTMRFFNAIILAFIGLTIANPIAREDELADRTDENLGPSLDKRATIPSVSGLKFNIDGTTAYFAGTNSYWLAFLTNNADVDLVMSHLKSSGLKVLRVWGRNTPKSDILRTELKYSRLQRYHQ